MSADAPALWPPVALPFSLRIDHIRCREDPQSPSQESPSDFYWSPPMSTSEFVKIDSSDWWTWDPGRWPQLYRYPQFCKTDTTGPGSELPTDYRSCTMFWSSERHGYIVVPVDCTGTNLGAEPYPWKRLSFGICASDPATALVGYQKERYRLHMPGPNHWFEGLLPDVCKPEDCEGARCTLTGDLSIVVGLLAFSSTPDHAVEAVHKSFRPILTSTKFQSHDLPEPERHKTRGMVITIGFDPLRVTTDGLKAWENGEYGGIFS
ncbi:hypothetical protein A1O7_05132 [Cladophialophora yegresii CBS 114405]|uniref:Uncharacterized protein n=1 Tax=Cladophialophora yegresii CBS 114405 TaxID=1182544 RepID=W9WRK9_9EURO|nr:uncharacterized protein A1O7_05132 [Cladophialophora yegresii CBS 114405]EXJ60979.1 hypothetical protein A1O7_05132 [Cladophialophora yegresii CBS 114405]